MRAMLLLPVVSLLAQTRAPASPDPVPSAGALARLPVREVTVFKDGHALMLHAGRMPVDAGGRVVLDTLPNPVMGTFWPYSSDSRARLAAVTASRQTVRKEVEATSLRDLLEANPGAEVTVQEVTGRPYAARVVGPAGQPAAGPPGAGPFGQGDIVLLKTAAGTLAVPLQRIQALTFKGEPRRKVARQEERNLLTLQLDWKGAPAGASADVGMLYVQKGVRWIPGYKVALDGRGTATVQMNATLINELTDLDDVTANLVIGVPTFFFQDTPDPIGLQDAFGPLSRYFQASSQTNLAFSNAIMSQAARAGERFGDSAAGPAGQPGGAMNPELSAAERSEDLFVFTARHVSLKKGQRMVVPIAEYRLPYRDIYALEVPFSPPAIAPAGAGGEQARELARLAAAPKVTHRIRMTNASAQPLTTAPALITDGQRVLGQGMMTYTSPGTTVDLTVTTAPDVGVVRSEKETGRVPNAVEWQGSRFARVDMAGTLTLANHKAQPIEVEVSRYIVGQVDTVGADGTQEMLNPYDEAAANADYAGWWRSYNWPVWSANLNGIGRFRWKRTVEPGKSLELPYGWHYFQQ